MSLQPTAQAQHGPQDAAPDDLTLLVESYRRGPVAERVTVRATDVSGRTKEAVITLRVDRGDAAAGRPATLRLDMGALTVFAQEHRVVVVHALNPDEFFEGSLEGGLSPRGLARVLPATPLPQVGWALGDALPRQRPDEGWPADLWGLGACVLYAATPGRWEGASDRGGVVEVTGGEDGLRSLSSSVSAQPNAVRLAVSCQRLAPSDPESWALSTAGRRPLASLTLLRARPGLISPGSQLPAMGLMKADLSGWSLTDALRNLEQKEPASAGFKGALLVFFDPRDDVAIARARVAAAGAARLAHSPGFDGTGAGDARLVVVSVGILELQGLSPAAVEAAGSRWRLAGPPAGLEPPVWTTLGKETLDRVLAGQRAGVVLIDAAGRIVHVVALARSETDEWAVMEELKSAIQSLDAVAPVQREAQPGAAGGER